MNNTGKYIATGLLTVLAGSMVSSNALSDEKSGHGPVPFAVFDMDEDGFISEAEFYSTREQQMAAKASEGKKMRCAASAPSFADLDTNGDGRLDPDELTAGQSTHMKKCQSMGQGAGQEEK